MRQKKISEMTEQELKDKKYIVNLKGKEYCTTSYRLLLFREDHPTWAIRKEVLFRDQKSIVIRCWIEDEDKRIVSEDFAEELASSHLPTIEKASTDAMGRALANLGYTTVSIASYEEMERFESRRETPVHGTTRHPRHNRPTPKPKINPVELERNLRSNTDWMEKDKFPWESDTDKGKRKFTWCEMFDISTIKNKDGKSCEVRQYLRTVAGATKESNIELSLKCTITADKIKAMDEDLEKSQAELFEGDTKEQEVNQYKEEVNA